MSQPDRQVQISRKEARREASRQANADAEARKAKKIATDQRNRRLLIRAGALGVVGLGLAGITYFTTEPSQTTSGPEMPKGSDLLSGKLHLQKAPEIIYPTNITKDQISDSKSAPSASMDRNYLTELLSQLQEETSISEDRPNKVVNNLSLIVVGGGTLTALMIDNSGIFLTAAHAFRSLRRSPTSTPEKPRFDLVDKGVKAEVIYPSLRRRYGILEYIADQENDMAIFYAPTDYRRERPVGIQVDLRPLREGEELWQTALKTEKDSIQTSIIHGITESSARTAQLNSQSPFKNEVAVADMIPFGGSSGSPIIDASGKLVAIEVGAYVKPGVTGKSQTRDDYGGSIISALPAFRELIRNGSLTKLPR